MYLLRHKLKAFCMYIKAGLRQRLEFDMEYHIFPDFITSTLFKEKSSDHFKDPHKLKLLTNFDANLITLEKI